MTNKMTPLSGVRVRPRDPHSRLHTSGELRERTSLVRAPMDEGRARHFEPFESASRVEIAAMQEQKLLDMLPHVYANSPLIRAVWEKAGIAPSQIKSIADFTSLAPFIDKDMVREYRDAHDDAFGGVLCQPLTSLSVICSSSGTTGDPTLFADRWGDPSIQYHTLREYWEAGVRPGDYAALLTLTMRPPGHTVFNDLGVVPLTFNHDPRELRRLLEWSRTYRPTVLMMLSSILLHGLEQLEREGEDIREAFSSYKICIFGGETLGQRAQGLIERWGIPLRSMTALGDVGASFECSAKDGHHAWEDLALVEVLDPQTQRPVQDGERGELVVSSLHDRVVPFLRFRSGDLVRYTRAPCHCGRTHLRYWILGRLGDEILVQGKSVLPADLWPAIESIPETASAMFQIIRTQRDMTTLQLRVGYDGEPDFETLRQKIALAVKTAIGITPVVELIPNSELIKLGPPQKIPRVVKK